MALTEAEANKDFYPRILSLQFSASKLAESRSANPFYADLRIMDGMRVLCLLWVITLGVCQSTMTSAVYNPWTL